MQRALVLLILISGCGTNAPQPPVVCLHTCFAEDGECYGYTTEADPQDCGIVAYEDIDKHALLSAEDTEKMKNYASILREYIIRQEKELNRCKNNR